MITNRYCALILSVLVIVLASTYCTLEKEPVIPAGETNEESPVFLATELVRNAQNGILAKALLESRGNLNILRHGWVWSEHPGPTIQDSTIEVGTLSSDSFATQISGLALEKTYYFRPYVATASGEIYGPEHTIVLIPTFTRFIEGGAGFSVQQTTDGGFILLGINNNGDMYLVKTNESGVIQWEKTYGASGFIDVGHSVQQTTDGGFILLGSKFYDLHMADMYLVKTNETGELQWEKTFEFIEYPDFYFYGYSVQQTTDGGFILLGDMVCPITNCVYPSSMYLVKTNGTGELQWEKTFGFIDFINGRSVRQATDGGFILLGSNQNNMYLVKTNGTGELQWEKIFGSTSPGSNAEGYSVQQTADGGYILLGGKNDNMYLVKTNGTGELQWEKIFGSLLGNAEGYSVQQTTDGGFILLGVKNSNMYLVKTNGTGELQWEKTFPSIAISPSVQQTSDGGFILLGSEFVSFDSAYIYLIKTDENGNTY